MSATKIIASYYILLFIITGIVSACNMNSDKENAIGSDSAEKQTDTPAIRQEIFPPEGFIEDLKTQATDIALVQLIHVDSVYGATKVFKTKVIKAYKGKLNANENMSYAGMSEKIYSKSLSDTLVVFLVKHKKPLTNLNIPNVYYSSVEDNAVIKPSAHLDSLLKKHR